MIDPTKVQLSRYISSNGSKFRVMWAVSRLKSSSLTMYGDEIKLWFEGGDGGWNMVFDPPKDGDPRTEHEDKRVRRRYLLEVGSIPRDTVEWKKVDKYFGGKGVRRNRRCR